MEPVRFFVFFPRAPFSHRRCAAFGRCSVLLALTRFVAAAAAAKRAKSAAGAELPPMRKDPSDTFEFPFDLSTYRKVEINPFTDTELSAQQLKDLKFNIDLCRDAIVFFTACGAASGYGGHTGGAFDTVPEVMLMDAFFRTCPDKFVPIFFDEAGHRVATQYLMSALEGHIDPELLRFYRKGHNKLPGHPELGLTPGVKFSSGRLGHMRGTVNGVAMANPGKIVFMLGSDGSQVRPSFPPQHISRIAL